MKDFLLCKDCEDPFNKRGEAYAMSLVNQAGRFPLLEALQKVTPTKIAVGFSGYDIIAVPNVDRQKLGYFALSVFWRAAVHVWRKPEPASEPIDLGPYEESLRRYLLGETGLPANVVLFFIVCTDAASQDSFHVPSRGRKDQDTTYTFQARAIKFFMTVGKRISVFRDDGTSEYGNGFPKKLLRRESGVSQHAIDRFLDGERIHPGTRKKLAETVDKLERRS